LLFHISVAELISVAN